MKHRQTVGGNDQVENEKRIEAVNLERPVYYLARQKV
jgi:hypothetical protein